MKIIKGLTIINTYVRHPPPSADFSKIRKETEGVLKIAVVNVLLVEDFNVHSQSWEYQDFGARVLALIDFLLLNSLIVVQILPNAPATFRTERNQRGIKGKPDLTVSSLNHSNKINDWTVRDEMTHSDHRYINFTIHSDIMQATNATH